MLPSSLLCYAHVRSIEQRWFVNDNAMAYSHLYWHVVAWTVVTWFWYLNFMLCIFIVLNVCICYFGCLTIDILWATRIVLRPPLWMTITSMSNIYCILKYYAVCNVWQKLIHANSFIAPFLHNHAWIFISKLESKFSSPWTHVQQNEYRFDVNAFEFWCISYYVISVLNLLS